MRVRIAASCDEMARTLTIRSSPEETSCSRLVVGADGISPSSGTTAEEGEPEVTSMNLSPSSPRVLMRAWESARMRCS